MTDADLLEGYRDGFRDDREALPDSLSNRSDMYCFGWQNGRDDRMGHPRASAAVLRGELTRIQQAKGE